MHVLSGHNDHFKELLNDLGSGESLTVVVGAGASVDAGLPTWTELIRTILENGFEAAKKRHEVTMGHEDLAAEVLDGQDLLQAATIGRLLHGPDRTDAIKRALFEGQSDPLQPGRVARALAFLCVMLEGRVRFITTNFDDVLEQAVLRETPYKPNSKVVDERGRLTEVPGYEEGTVEVIHLHGFIPRHGSAHGQLVLDERDFAIEPVRPPGPVLPSLLSTDQPTLFLGLSFTDPNLVAACTLLNPRGSRTRWHGLFVTDGDSTRNVERYKQMRIQQLGVKPLKLVSFGQISQVVYELAHRVSYDDDYWTDDSAARYGLRLVNWRRGYEQRNRGLLGGDQFNAEHNSLHRVLGEKLDELLGNALRTREADEHFGIHVWVRRPSDDDLGHLELVGSSSNMHREHWSLSSRVERVRRSSGHNAVNALYYGSVQRRNAGEEGSRWQATMAVPVELRDAPHNFLLAGVMTLSSTHPMNHSALRDGWGAAAAALAEQGRRTLGSY